MIQPTRAEKPVVPSNAFSFHCPCYNFEAATQDMYNNAFCGKYDSLKYLKVY